MKDTTILILEFKKNVRYTSAHIRFEVEGKLWYKQDAHIRFEVEGKLWYKQEF